MTASDTTTKALRLRELGTVDSTLVLPNAWDAGSAAVIAAAGATAIATTSGGVSWSLGFRDGQHVGRAEMVEAARQEPGIEIYSYHRGDGNTFSFFALMSGQEAMQHHGQTEAMRAAMAAFGPLMAEPPQMSVSTPIAAIGFDV